MSTCRTAIRKRRQAIIKRKGKTSTYKPKGKK